MLRRRLVVVLGSTVLLGCCVLGATAGPAAAYRGGPSSPINQVANKELVRAIIADIDAQGLNATLSTQGKTAMWRAQVAAFRFAPLGAVGSVVLGSFTVWKIADAAGLSGFVYRKITGHDAYESVGSFTVTMTYTSNFGDQNSNSKFDAEFGGDGVPVWGMTNSASGVKHCFGSGGCHAGAFADGKTVMAQFAGIGHVESGSPSCGGTLPYSQCVVRWKTVDEMEGTVSVTPSTATEFAAQPAANQKTGGSNNDAGDTTVTDDELAAAIAALGGNDGVDRSATDPGAEEVVDAINEQIEEGYDPSVTTFVMPDCVGISYASCETSLDALDATGTRIPSVLEVATADITRPAGAVVTQSIAPTTVIEFGTELSFDVNPDAAEMPMYLPAPNPGETYTTYIARLQGDGWVGTATVTTLSEEAGDPRMGPDAPITAAIPAIGPIPATVARTPGSWPTPGPRILPDTDITFTKNPTTYAPVPPGEIPPATGAPDGVIDFSPITDIDPGCKFPYGFICYAIDVTEWFNVAPVAPVFSFDIPAVTVAGTTYDCECDYGPVDLAVLDDYMAIIRSLMSVVMWIGAVYWLAVRLLGFNAGGDPGEAVDEGLNY